MKRILFISLAVILALSVGLIGCAGEQEEEEEYVIKIAVCGPLTDLQGQNHKDGANMAVSEIGTVQVGSQTYTLQTVDVETLESASGEDGTTGSTNLAAVIDDVTFCVGGFRTEVVDVYRDVAMDNGVLFMDCGAATDSLTFDVVTDYATYKYWFKSTPYNSTFLVKSLLKMTATIGGLLGGTLSQLNAVIKADYQVGSPQDTQLRVVILMENAAWCAGMVTAAQYYLPLLGYNVTSTILVSPTATTIGTANWNTILADKPHIIFTAFSGAVGAKYSIERVSNDVPAVTIGINVPGQQLSHWVNTNGDCEGEIMLDTWGVGMNNTALTGDWFDDFMALTGRYPVYTAGTYDAIKAVCKAIEATDSLDSDDLVAWLEDPDNAYTESVASPLVGYYPMPAITLEADVTYALNESQVREFYDIDSYGYAYSQNDWLCGESSKPHIAHDLLYGPGLVTGCGTQWQIVTGAGAKVGIWPMHLTVPSEAYWDAALTDQYGNWNFEYPGKTNYIFTIGGMLAAGTWDPYTGTYTPP